MFLLYSTITRNILLPAIAATLFIPQAIAADFSVSGKIISKDDSEPCPGASCKVFTPTDTIHPAAFNVADPEGYFKMTLPSAGDYLLKVEYMGMKSQERSFSVSKEYPTAGLGAIALLPDSETLKEVVVSVRRKLIQSDGATLTYNVEEDPEASSNNTIEMLRKVPMVTIDAEDNIKVNGQSNFKILINGKEDPMLQGDVKTILKSMPAATIKKIEVITEPGAKYDAEGTGGVLNIVTIGKQSLEGFMTNLNLRATTNNYGASIYGRTKVRNVTASANFNYNDSFDLGYLNDNTSVVENLTSDDNRYQTTESKSKSKWNYMGGNINLSWEPDTLNLFTVQGNIGKNDFNSYNIQTMSLENIDRVKQWSLDRDYDSEGKYLWLGANASFQHTFGKQGHHIVGSYIFGYNTDTSDQRTMTHNMVNIEEEYPWRLNTSDSYSRRHALQADYSNPISEKHLLEAGMKANWHNSYQNSNPYYGTLPDNMEIRESEAISMMQFQDIMAAYVSYNGTFGKWNTKVGLRYEHTRLGLKYYVGDYDNFTSNLGDLVPNAAISYKMGDAASLRLAYQMRIWRPGLWNLNPYRNTMTPNEVRYGNPDLDSEKSHGLTLSYSNYGGKLGGSLSVGYRRADNAISDYQFFQDNVLHTTYANIGHSQRTSANLNLQWNVVTTLNIGVYLSGSYEDYKADSPVLKAKSHNWQGNYNLDLNYTLPAKIRLSAYCGGGSGWADLQSKGSGWSYHGLSLSRSFFKEDAMTISAYASNIFMPDRTSTLTQTTETSIFNSISHRRRQWSVGGSIAFKFGSLRTDVKRTGANLDMESGGGQGGGSKGDR